MITVEALLVTVVGLDRAEVEHLVSLDLVRPEGSAPAWRFREIDVARLRLIQDLRHGMGISDDALPVVLRLLDQLYDTRRQLRRLGEAVERAAPGEVRDRIVAALLDRAGQE